MKIIRSLLLLILTSIIFASCTNKKTIIVDGHTYIQLSTSKTNDNGTIDVELWQRYEVTNKYYTLSLDGKSMVPIMK